MSKHISVVIVVVYFSIILFGALLLMLPFSTHKGSIHFVDSLFTTTSAVTVTGLAVTNTADTFTTFGQIVIILLIQIGGIGFMSFSTFAILVLGKSISIKDKHIIENTYSVGGIKNLREMINKILILTFTIEFIGALLLFFQFHRLDLFHRIFASIFHAISAFCNAGFSIFRSGLEHYVAHWGVNFTIMALIVIGGIGFLVLNDIGQLFFRKKIYRFSKLTLHTRMVLVITLFLILIGSLVIFVEELINKTNNLSLPAKFLVSTFQAVSARTAGFNTVNLNIFGNASIFILILLMFIGASPGSTGGGVKTTSAGVVLAYLRSLWKGSDRTYIFYRNISAKNVEKAFIVIIFSFIMVSLLMFFVLSFDPGFLLRDVLFELVSAFGTVGLSLGITRDLSYASKIVVSLMMFMGKIGPLTLLMAVSRKEPKGVFKYAEENVMIG